MQSIARRRSLLAAAAASAALGLAVAAQFDIDRFHGKPSSEIPWLDIAVGFLVAAGLWLWSLRSEDEPPAEAVPARFGPRLTRRRWQLLVIGLGCVLLTAVVVPAAVRLLPESWATLHSGLSSLRILRYPEGPNNPTNELTPIGSLLWIFGTLLTIAALADWSASWLPDKWPEKWTVALRITPLGAALIGITLLAAAFRFYDLAALPLEMTSDHTEKLRDIANILGGNRPVYLPANAGREPLQFYWTAALVTIGLPLSFMTLKAGMALLSTLTVPVVYYAGRQVAGRHVGLMAALVIALSPWHIQITRIGLRIAMSPLFAALTLALLYLALTSGKRNHWLALGVVIGAGMYGYSGYRPMALAAVVVIALRLALSWGRERSQEDGRQSEPQAGPQDPRWRAPLAGARRSLSRALPQPLAEHMFGAAGLSLLVAAPLIRFALDHGETFWGRTASRLHGEYGIVPERPALEQFLINWKQTLLMFNYTSDSAWFQSPPGRPALETVGGALIVLGVLSAAYKLWHGDWRVGGLLFVLPLMLLSTVMALAFPQEVPHLSRASGAIPIVAILAALPLAQLSRRWREAIGPPSKLVYAALIVVLFAWMANNTSSRYFGEYREFYNNSTHPTQEAAEIARAMMALGVDLEHIYLVGWSHGWDYRALGAHLGDPFWDGLLFGAENGSDAVLAASGHVGDPAAKLYFLGGPFAPAHIEFLEGQYANAITTHHHSETTGKDFWSVYVPASGTEEASDASE